MFKNSKIDHDTLFTYFYSLNDIENDIIDKKETGDIINSSLQKTVNLFLKKFNSINAVANSNVEEIKKVVLCAGMQNVNFQRLITEYILMQ